MKTAYELAMERLNKTAPAQKLTKEQKKELAELESKYAAKIAEREITLRGELARAMAEGNLDEATKLEQHLAADRQKLQAELDEKKETIRRGQA